MACTYISLAMVMLYNVVTLFFSIEQYEPRVKSNSILKLEDTISIQCVVTKIEQTGVIIRLMPGKHANGQVLKD